MRDLLAFPGNDVVLTSKVVPIMCGMSSPSVGAAWRVISAWGAPPPGGVGDPSLDKDSGVISPDMPAT